VLADTYSTALSALDLQPRLVTNIISEAEAGRVAIDTRPTVTAAATPLTLAESRPVTFARPLAATTAYAPVEVPPAQDPNTIVHPPVPAPTYTEAVTAPTTILRPVEIAAVQDPNTIVHPPVPAPTYTEVEDANTIVYAPIPAPTYTEAVTEPATPVVPFDPNTIIHRPVPATTYIETAAPATFRVSMPAPTPVQDPNTIVHAPVPATTYAGGATATEVVRQETPTPAQAASTLRQFAEKLNTNPSGPQACAVTYAAPGPAVKTQAAPQMMMMKVKVPMATVEPREGIQVKMQVPAPVVAPSAQAKIVVKKRDGAITTQPVPAKQVVGAGAPIPVETQKSIAEELGPRVQPAPSGVIPGRSMFDLLDANKDGAITRTEFAQAVAGPVDVIREVTTSEAQVPAWVRQEALPAPASTPTADGAVAAVAGGVTVRRSAGASGAKTAAAKPQQRREASTTRAVRLAGTAAAATRSKSGNESASKGVSAATGGAKTTVRAGVRSKS